MDLPALAQLVFELVGGLGIFLLGMKNMSEGMQAVAGNSLRRIVKAVTNHRILAILCGVLVTCVVQSSSITTVMVVGLVNSGVMQLTQAIGVIMGANIGTTITGWILVLKIGKYGLPILGGAAFVYLFSKGDRWRFWAMSIMGIGMIFFGLELMKDACKIIANNPNFESWFQIFRADSYLGVLKCALVGCVLTTLVQSSSATLGITLSLAYTGVIPYETAAALVLGENIGTTITAFLASLGATTNARRAAYFHVIFNLVGVFWITLLFAWYIDLIEWSVTTWMVEGSIDQAFIDEGATVYKNTGTAIAATHTIFNIANTIIFFPFMFGFVRLLNWLVPSKDSKEKPLLTDLDVRILETPVLAIEQSRKEIEKMGDGCEKMLDWLNELLQQDEPDHSLADRLRRREQVLDSMQNEIAEFVTRLLSGSVPHSAADDARRQLSMADEYESISNYIADLDKFDHKLRRDGHRFTPDQQKGLVQLNRQMAEYLKEINLGLAQDNRTVLTQTTARSDRLKKQIEQLRRQHLDDLSTNSIAPQVSVAYLATLNAYSRVRDHSRNIAEAISGEK